MSMNHKEQLPLSGAFLILISVFGITGNTLTLTLVKKTKTFRKINQARIILGNLALVDLLNSALGLISGMGYINKSILMSGNMELCYITAYATTILPYLSIFALTLFIINRHYTTVYQKEAKRLFSSSKTWLYIIIIWGFLMLMTFIEILLSSGINPVFRTEQGSCKHEYNASRSAKSRPNWYFPLVGSLSLICSLLMFYLNARICITIRKHNKRIRDQDVIEDAVFVERNRKITQITLVIFVCYIICYTPIVIHSLLSLKKNLTQFSYSFVYLFYNINYVNNVFIYGAMDKVYRRNVKRIFCVNSVESL